MKSLQEFKVHSLMHIQFGTGLLLTQMVLFFAPFQNTLFSRIILMVFWGSLFLIPVVWILWSGWKKTKKHLIVTVICVFFLYYIVGGFILSASEILRTDGAFGFMLLYYGFSFWLFFFTFCISIILTFKK